MTHGQGEWYVDKVAQLQGQSFKVSVSGFEPHGPATNKWAKPTSAGNSEMLKHI